MDDYENITQRRRDTHDKNRDISSDSEFDMDVSYQSLPNVVGNNVDIAMMKKEIAKLKWELQTANSEIDQLSLENTTLKNNLLDCSRKINLLKSIGIQDKSNQDIAPRQFYSPQYQRRVRTLLMPRTSSREYTIQALNLISPKAVANDSVVDKNMSPGIDEQLSLESPANMVENLRASVIDTSILNFSKDQSSDSVQHSLIDEPIDAASSTRDINNVSKSEKRVMILCNEQGNGLRHSLNQLLGSDYTVSSFIKSGTTLRNLVNTARAEIAQYNMCDYVIVVGGCYDRNPYDTEMNLHAWLSSIKNTNIIISEVHSSRYLNEAKLNYMLRFVCGKYENVIFMDMDYSRHRPRRTHFVLNLSRSILREILQLDYKFKSQEYLKLLCVKNKNKYVDKSVQTNLTNCNYETVYTQTNLNNSLITTDDNVFFRD